jgi:hypothetical protein
MSAIVIKPKSTDKPVAISAAQSGAIDLERFTLDFFSAFGSTVSRQGRKKQAAYQIDLPAEMAGHFGRPTLHLCFHQQEMAPGLDLVTPGSRVFDRMITYLEGRGAMTHLRLPARRQGSDELLRAVRPVNAAIAGLRLQESRQTLLVFNWRITYRADDKREELYTVVLNEAGEHLPQAGQGNGLGVNIARLYADAEPAPVEPGEDGQPRPAALPPMTHLTKLAETARKYAIYHADACSLTHEAEILPRLYKVLNRLTSYYQQQMEETYDAHDVRGEKRQALESDLQRKIAEEVENHRLRVEVKLVSYAVIQTPVATADLTLNDGRREITVQVRLDRYTGLLHRPTCHACNQETTALTLDRHGHITCDDCLRQCGACLELLCERCGVAACPVCGVQNCDECGRLCWACGERACTAHSSHCPQCGDEVCHSCQAECARCGVRQCRSHLRADHVAASQGLAALICAECAVRCPGCQQYSAQIETCRASGQRFCTNCLVACAKCSRRVGPGFYRVIKGWSYCLDCLDGCPSCHAQAPTILACAACGGDCCETCGLVCDQCGGRFCPEHAQRSKSCEHVLCSEHGATCHLCQTPVCPVCEAPCGICERAFCVVDGAICQQCGQSYCRECVRRTGLCDTCATLHRQGKPVDLATEPCGADPKVIRLATAYRWLRGENERYLVYVGDGSLTARMVVVVDKAGNPATAISVRKVPPLDVLMGKLWR